MDAAAASPDAPEEDARAAAAAAPVPTASRVRGIYAREDEAAPYLMNGIPTFETKAACEKWVREHCASKDPPSNPDRPHMTQMLTTLCTWPQVEAYVLGARDAYLARYPPRPAPSSNAVAENLWVLDASAKSADAELRSRLSLPCHRLLSSDSTLATLSYLFDHMRSGIYVLIRRNHVCVFAPFVNQDYENAWGPRLELDENQTVEQRRGRAAIPALVRIDDGRGDAVAATWIVRGDGSRRRRGCHVGRPRRRVAATPRLSRGSSEGAGRGDAAWFRRRANKDRTPSLAETRCSRAGTTSASGSS